MGSHFSPQGKGLFEDFAECFEDFGSSEWNADLLESQCRYMIFKSDEESNLVPIYPDEDLQVRVLEVISLPKFNFMKEL